MSLPGSPERVCESLMPMLVRQANNSLQAMNATVVRGPAAYKSDLEAARDQGMSSVMSRTEALLRERGCQATLEILGQQVVTSCNPELCHKTSS
jgi:hypothetical protein